MVVKVKTARTAYRMVSEMRRLSPDLLGGITVEPAADTAIVRIPDALADETTRRVMGWYGARIVRPHGT